MAERELLGEGREAEVFACDDGTVLRLLREPSAGVRVAREGAALRSASAAGAPVPQPGELVTVSGRPGLVMERIVGPDWLALLGRRPWLVVAGARTLGDVHARLHEVVAPTELPTTRNHIRARIGTSDRVPARLARVALDKLERLPDGDSLCHNDFHPANILRTSSGSVVIDWSDATRGDPMGDVARTLLVLQVGVLPPGAPAFARGIDRVGRRLLAAGYQRAYQRRRPLDTRRITDWRMVRVVDRLVEPIDAERSALLALAATLT